MPAPLDWAEVESSPWFNDLTPELKSATSLKWRDSVLSEQGDMDNDSKLVFLAASEAKSKSYLGKPIDGDPIKAYFQEREARTDEVDRGYQGYVNGEFDDPEFAELDDTFKGRKDSAVVRGSLFVNPAFVLDKDKYEEAVKNSNASIAEKTLAMAQFKARNEQASETLANTLGYTDEGFRTFASERYNQGKTNAQVINEWREKQKLPDGIFGTLAGVGRQVKLGFQGGLAGLERAIGGLGMGAGVGGEQYAAESGAEAASFAARRELAGGPSLVGEVAEGAVSLIPTLAVGAVGAALTPTPAGPVAAPVAAAAGRAVIGRALTSLAAGAVTGGLQSAGATVADAFEVYKQNGLSDAEAIGKARVDGAVAGIITGTVTGLMGTLGKKFLGGAGIETLFRRKASQVVAVAGEKTLRTAIKTATKSILGNATEEAIEEGTDQLLQGLYEAATRSPEKDFQSILEETFHAAKIGGILGGGMQTIKSGITFKSLLQTAAVDPNLDPVQQAAVAQRVADANQFQRDVDAAVEETVDQNPEVAAANQAAAFTAAAAQNAKQNNAPLVGQALDQMAGQTDELAKDKADAVRAEAERVLTEAQAPLSAENIGQRTDQELQEAEQRYRDILRQNVTDPEGRENAEMAQQTLNRIRAEIAGREQGATLNANAAESDANQLKQGEVWLADQAQGMAEVIQGIVRGLLDKGAATFGGFVDQLGDVNEGRLAAYRNELRKFGKDLDIRNPIGDRAQWKKVGVKNFPIIDAPQVPTENLRAVATNTATPEQVAELTQQGLARVVDGQTVITDAGVAAMPEAERPPLSEAQRVAEIEAQRAAQAPAAETTEKAPATKNEWKKLSLAQKLRRLPDVDNPELPSLLYTLSKMAKIIRPQAKWAREMKAEGKGQRGSQWEWVDQVGIPFNWRIRLFKAGEGDTLDSAIQEIAEDNPSYFPDTRPEDVTPEMFGDKLKRSIDAFDKANRDMGAPMVEDALGQEMSVQEQQTIAFEAATQDGAVETSVANIARLGLQNQADPSKRRYLTLKDDKGEVHRVDIVDVDIVEAQEEDLTNNENQFLGEDDTVMEIVSVTVRNGPVFGEQKLRGTDPIYFDALLVEAVEQDATPEETVKAEPTGELPMDVPESRRPKVRGETEKPQQEDPLAELKQAKAEGENERAQGQMDLEPKTEEPTQTQPPVEDEPTPPIQDQAVEEVPPTAAAEPTPKSRGGKAADAGAKVEGKPLSEKVKKIRANREDAFARFRKVLGKTSMGLDPEAVAIAAEVAVTYVEEGVVRFADFVKQVRRDAGDLWDKIKPYLSGAWQNASAVYPELDEVTREQARRDIAEADAMVVEDTEDTEDTDAAPEDTEDTDAAPEDTEDTAEDEPTGEVSDAPIPAKPVKEIELLKALGFGKYRDTRIRTVMAKDPVFAFETLFDDKAMEQALAGANAGRVGDVRRLISGTEEYREYQKARKMGRAEIAADNEKYAEELESLQADFAANDITLTTLPNGVHQLTIPEPLLKTHEDIIRSNALQAARPTGVFLSPTSRNVVNFGRDLNDRLAGRPVGYERAAEYTQAKRTAERIRQELSVADDESVLTGKEVKEQVDIGTQKLLFEGVRLGMPRDVYEEQVYDAAMIGKAHGAGKPMFLLASQAGAGKTYILGAAIGRMKKQGAKKIVYVTTNQRLIEQIEKDLVGYDLEGVEFKTYASLDNAAKNPPEDTDVIIFDEGHNVRYSVSGKASDRAGKAAAWMKQSKFTVITSATPYESLEQMRYLWPTGVFKPFISDQMWGDTEDGWFGYAEVLGAKVLAEKGVPQRTQFPEKQEVLHAALLQAREFLRKSGMFTQRKTRVPPELVNTRFVAVSAEQKWVEMFNATEKALAKTKKKNPNLMAYVRNLQKRILEASKREDAVKLALKTVAEGKRTIIFTETKSERNRDLQEALADHKAWVDGGREGDPPDTMPKIDGVEDFFTNLVNLGITEINFESVQDYFKRELASVGVNFYTGDETDTQRKSTLSDWEEGRVPVMVATMASGGTGLSLHDKVGGAPRAQIVLNLPWRGTEVEQVAGRTARYGMRSVADAYWLFTNDIKFDQELAAKVGSRLTSMNLVVQGDITLTAQAVSSYDLSTLESLDDINNAPADALDLFQPTEVPVEARSELADMTAQVMASITTVDDVKYLAAAARPGDLTPDTDLVAWAKKHKKIAAEMRKRLRFSEVPSDAPLVAWDEQGNMIPPSVRAQAEGGAMASYAGTRPKNPVEVKEAFESAVKRHGLTRDISEAGYILPDGRLLDFSGRADASGYVREGDFYTPRKRGDRDWMGGSRGVDHRDVEWEGMPSYPETWMPMVEFMAMGAVRIDRSGAIHVHGRRGITSAQKARIADLLIESDGNFYLDMEDDEGKRASISGEGAKASKVAGFIQRWKDGWTPESDTIVFSKPPLHPVYGLVKRRLTSKDRLHVKEAFRMLGKMIPNIRDLVVVDSLDNLLKSKDLSAEEKAKLREGAQGIYSKGRAFVAFDNVWRTEYHTNEAAAIAATMVHELMHKGAAIMRLSPDLAPVYANWKAMLDQYVTESDLVRQAKLYPEYIGWRENTALKEKAQEEVLVRRMETLFNKGELLTKEEGSLMKRFLSVIRSLVNKLLGKSVSQSEDVVRRWGRFFAVAASSRRITEDEMVEDIRTSYIGERAQMAPFMRDALDTAKAMAAAGKSSEEIRAVTGWFPGLYDGKMRFELPDNQAAFVAIGDYNKKTTAAYGGPAFSRIALSSISEKVKSGKFVKLSDVFQHNELFAAYPEAANIPFFPIAGNVVQGSHRVIDGKDIITATVTLNEEGDVSAESASTILHELQHFIQQKESFTVGGSPDNLITKADIADAAKFRDAYLGIRKYKREIENLVSALEQERAKKSFVGFGGPNQKVIKSIEDSITKIQESINSVWDYQKKNLNIDRDSTRASLLSALNLVDSKLGGAWVLNKRNEGLDMLYRLLAGEIESRDVQARQNFTPEQRRATAPYSSENIAPEDAIVMFGGSDIRASMVQSQQDREYLAAVEAGDMETAQRMVDEAAEAAGGPPRGHVYSPKGAVEYIPTVKIMQWAKGRPDFDSGRFVRGTDPLQDAVAVEESARVLAEDWAENRGGFINYDPEAQQGGFQSPYPTLVRDDQGNIIPLSQRFNPQSSDIRASVAPTDESFAPRPASLFSTTLTPEEERDAAQHIRNLNPSMDNFIRAQVLGNPNTGEMAAVQPLGPQQEYTMSYLGFGEDEAGNIEVTPQATKRVKDAALALLGMQKPGEVNTFAMRYQEEMTAALGGPNRDAAGAVLQMEIVRYGLALLARGDASLIGIVRRNWNSIILGKYLTMASAGRLLQVRSHYTGVAQKTISEMDASLKTAALDWLKKQGFEDPLKVMNDLDNAVQNAKPDFSALYEALKGRKIPDPAGSPDMSWLDTAREALDRVRKVKLDGIFKTLATIAKFENARSKRSDSDIRSSLPDYMAEVGDIEIPDSIEGIDARLEELKKQLDEQIADFNNDEVGADPTPKLPKSNQPEVAPKPKPTPRIKPPEVVEGTIPTKDLGGLDQGLQEVEDAEEEGDNDATKAAIAKLESLIAALNKKYEPTTPSESFRAEIRRIVGRFIQNKGELAYVDFVAQMNEAFDESPTFADTPIRIEVQEELIEATWRTYEQAPETTAKQMYAQMRSVKDVSFGPPEKAKEVRKSIRAAIVNKEGKSEAALTSQLVRTLKSLGVSEDLAADIAVEAYGQSVRYRAKKLAARVKRITERLVSGGDTRLLKAMVDTAPDMVNDPAWQAEAIRQIFLRSGLSDVDADTATNQAMKQADAIFTNSGITLQKGTSNVQSAVDRLINRWAQLQSDTPAWKAQKARKEGINDLFRQQVRLPVDEKEFVEQAAAFGATPRQAFVLFHEAATVRRNRGGEKLTNVQALVEFLKKVPQDLLNDPKNAKLRNHAIEGFLKANGLTPEQIRTTMPWVSNNLDDFMQQARDSAVKRILAQRAAYAKAMDAKENDSATTAADKELQRVLQMIRAGIASGSTAAEALAEQEGFTKFSDTDMQTLAKFDARITAAEAEGRVHDQGVAIKELFELMARRRAPKKFLERLVVAYNNSALSGIGTIGINLYGPVGSIVTRVALDMTRIIATRDWDMVSLMFNSIFDTVSEAYGEAAFALRGDAYTNAMQRMVLQVSNLRVGVDDSLKVLRDEGASPWARTKALGVVIQSYTDVTRRILSTADQTWFATMQGYFYKMQASKALLKNNMAPELVQQHLFTVTQTTQMRVASDKAMLAQYEERVRALRGKSPEEIRKGINNIIADTSYQTGNPGNLSPENLKYQRTLNNEIRSALRNVSLAYKRRGELGVTKLLGELKLQNLAADVRRRDLMNRDIHNFLTETLGEGEAKRIKDFAEKEAEYEIGNHRGENGATFDIFNQFSRMVQNVGYSVLQRNPLMGRMMLGYFGVPVNLLNRAMWFTPYGLIRYALAKRAIGTQMTEKGINISDLYQQSMQNSMQMQQRFSEAILGMSVFSLGMALKALGDDDDELFNVTLAGPANKTEYDAWVKNGHRKGAIEMNVGGKVYSLNWARGLFEPWKPAFVAIGAFDDMKLNRKLGDKENQIQVINYLGAAMSGWNQQTAFFGAKTTIGATFGATPDTNMLGTVAYKASPLIPFSGFLNSVSKFYTGPNTYRGREGAIWANIPVASVFKTQRAVNALGDPVGVTGGPLDTLNDRAWYAGFPLGIGGKMSTTDARVYEFILERGTGPGIPQRSAIESKNGFITDAQFLDYVAYRGRIVKAKMMTSLSKLKAMDDESLTKAIGEISTDATREAKRRFNYK
jgi:hypothetical protein